MLRMEFLEGILNPRKVFALTGTFAAAALLLVACAPKTSTTVTSSSTTEATATAAPSATTAPATDAPGYKSVTGAKVTFQWKVDGKMLDCILRAPTTGWVGVGFGTTGQMKGSEIFLGYVQNGQATIKDEFGDATNHHTPVTELGSQSIIADESGTQTNGTTELRFSIPLDVTGKYHVALVPGQQYLLLLAHAPEGAADTSTYHGGGNRTVVQITL